MAHENAIAMVLFYFCTIYKVVNAELIELWFNIPLDTKIGHFGGFPQESLGLVWKTRPNTTKALIHQSKEMYSSPKKPQKN